jgi:hypothetical protein
MRGAPLSALFTIANAAERYERATARSGDIRQPTNTKMAPANPLAPISILCALVS